MTDPTGRVFISHRRSRAGEVRLLVQSHRDHGIPTWQDVDDLGHGPTEDQLREALEDEGIASGVLWITPEVAASDIIRKVEAPALVRRARRRDPFFLVPVAAGGLDYDDAAALIDIPLDDLKNWNMLRVDGDPIRYEAAVDVTRRVLKHRLRAIHRTFPPGDPILMRFHTRRPAPVESAYALTLDWSHRFTTRETSQEEWASCLLPALEAIVEGIRVNAPGRQVNITGLPSLPAAFALGRAFLETSGVPVAWGQRGELWSLRADRMASGVVDDSWAGDPASDGLAVLVAINANVRSAMTKSDLPAFRGHVEVRHPRPSSTVRLTAGEALDVALRVTDAVREARMLWSDTRRVHLFAAVPAGIAVLIGQFLNTLGPVQTYEHIQDDAQGIYRPAALLLDR
jgi:hypothetical protein